MILTAEEARDVVQEESEESNRTDNRSSHV